MQIRSKTSAVRLASRRRFLTELTTKASALVAAVEWTLAAAPSDSTVSAGPKGIVSAALAEDWLRRWEGYILADARNRYCDKELGEELGWLVAPFLEGYYYGYCATGDVRWVDRLVGWADAWIARGVREPDGFVGWPKPAAAGTGVDDLNALRADSMLGEAMCLRPLVLMAGRMRRDPVLQKAYEGKASAYLALAEQIFQKWDDRGAWKETRHGGVWVVQPFGMAGLGGGWTEGYARRKDARSGFSHPANKANADARWHMAMHDVTGKAVYRERAELWFREMKSRMRLREQGKYWVWNYWDPAGPWDYEQGGATKHWVGVHPNGGYYGIDVVAMAEAFERGLVFSREDVDRLIATNRDFMWNQKVQGAEFRRMDGEAPDDRWKKSPGVLWHGLLPYDGVLRAIFSANHDPGSWGGLSVTPWSLSIRAV